MVKFSLSYLIVVQCFFHFLFLHSHTASSIVEMPMCNHDDSSRLLQFKNSLAVNNNTLPSESCPSYPYSNTASWNNGTNCCRWDGVTCDAVSGHVIGLDLTCANLHGEVHSNNTLFHLTHLQELVLAGNDFNGSTIHHGIGNLVSLTHLNLCCSNFAGDVPSTISHLSKLVSLDLSYNGDTIFGGDRLRLGRSTWNNLILNATNLEELHLDYVNMSSIKEESLSLLMNLSSSLTSLFMGNTELQGNFPIDILCLPNLQQLSLSSNLHLRGELPKSNWSASSLFLLDLSSTAFSGEIPDSIGHLKSLNSIFLSNCKFDGLVPLALWNLTQLGYLSLEGNKLQGEISPLLSYLKHLTFLQLDFNNFGGHIPDVFANFTELGFLSISYNKLEGQVPLSLFDLTELYELDLSSNSLEGSIPSNITKFSKLQTLALTNNLLNGTIPHWCYSLDSLIELGLNGNHLSGSIGEFSTYSLKYLDLSNNKIQGSFVNSIFELENLTSIDLSSNELRGQLDFNKFSKLKNLIFLDLSHNSLSVEIDNSIDYNLPNLDSLLLSSCNITQFPQSITKLQDLGSLDLSNNNIQGKIPKWFNDNLLFLWKKMQYINLSFNKLHGELPTLPNATRFFSISNNNLTGDISVSLCNLTSLWLLNLSHNNLTGMIPQCLGSLPSLLVLDLQMNNLHGSLPRNFSKRNAFETIKLNDNLLEGPLPKSLAHCTSLKVLDLGGNYIQDTFPSWLETLSELQVLILRANKFHGIITTSSTKHPFLKLRIFDISNNGFTGPLPTSYFKNFQEMMKVNNGGQTGLKYMDSYNSYNDSAVVVIKGLSWELERILTTFTTIDLSNNMFEGEIPLVIGELNSLKGLNLSHNAITGVIPNSLGNLTSLEWLDLSWNQLKGEIPSSLTNLNFLSVMNFSQNQLEGPIPAGMQFNTFQNDSYGGNPMLCGTPLSKSCSNNGEERPTSTLLFHHDEKFGFGWEPVAVGYACGVVFGILLGYCFFLTGKPGWLARLVGFPGKKKKMKRANFRAHATRRGLN